MAKTLKFGLPKGSLQEATLYLLSKAGFKFRVGDRSYEALCDDKEINALLIRAQEMARYVGEGVFDAGITGLDWIKESGAEVIEVTDLIYSRSSMQPVRWVLAVPEASDIRSVKDLQGKRIATEVVNITREFLTKNKVNAEVEFSWGATEAKAPKLVDAIVEVTETGRSLEANKLRIIKDVLSSWPKLIANKTAWQNKWKRNKIENIALLLKAAIDAEDKVGLKMNVPRQKLAQVLKILPAITSPTVSDLSDKKWVALETVLEERQVRELIPQLKQAGAEGIIEYPLNKIVY